LTPAYALETVLIKIADYCDNKVRGHACIEPPREEMSATGLAEFDVEDWVRKHESIMEELGIPDLDN